MRDAGGMEKKIKKTKLERESLDENRPPMPSMSFRFGEETIEKLGALSVHLGRSMAATVRELIHAQYAAQFKDDESSAKEALKKWKSKRQ